VSTVSSPSSSGAHERLHRARALVVIPAFNEEAALPETLAELGSVRPDLDVVVVSDGSVDKTAALARAAGVHVIDLPFNLGIGGALQAGFRYAGREGYERAFQFDADGQHDPRELATLETALDAGASLVIGSRFGDGVVEYKVDPVRRLAMRTLGWCVNRLCKQKFTDTSSGFRGFDAKMLHFFSRSYPVEFMDSTESLLLASFAGFRVAEVPTRIRERSAGQPSTRNVRLVLNYLRLLVVIVSHLTRSRRHSVYS
jgi:glycosyltransferase involved in cell wall biosynthesis